MAPNSPPPRKGERSSDATETEQDIVDQLPTIGPIASQGQLPPQHRAPVTGTDHTHLVPPTPQTPFHTPMASHQRGGTHGVVSPAAAAESASTEYFPSLGQAPSRSSLRSGHSAFSELDSPALPRQPAIRIRRRGGSTGSQRSATDQAAVQSALDQVEGLDASGRPRSISQPERTYAGTGSANAARHSRKVPQQPMPRLTEEGNRPTMQDLGLAGGQDPSLPAPERTRSLEAAPVAEEQPGGLRRVGNFFWPRRTTVSSGSDGLPPVPASPAPQRTAADDEYDAAIVDYLDTIDPEVQTLSTLTNVQNSLFVPDLGSWLNRRPAYNLSVPAPDPQLQKPLPPPPPPPTTQPPPIPEGDEDLEREKAGERVGEGEVPERPDLGRTTTITSQVSDSHYATLPHGETLEGWTDRERTELDDHVRHMMHSRRSKFKRSLRGFGQYVRRPLGFFVTLYATLITLFGLIWVLLLIGWISVSADSDRQKYILHIVDSVLVALFAIMGDGLAPFRVVDTYHMCFIMHYARIVRRSRRKALKQQKQMDEAQAELKKQTTPSEYLPGNEATDPASPASPSLKDLQTGSQTRSTDNDGNTLTNDDQPELGRRDSYTLANNIQVDVEDARSDIQVYQATPLTASQQKSLYKHQTKLAKSHSFYRPNETSTHYAFPLNYAIAVIFLLDFHSCLQISLGATTWGIYYKTRNEAITSVILCVSITVNIIAGLVITSGGRKTRKKDVWERMTRQELTGDAIKHLQAKQARRAKKAQKGEAPKEKKPLKVQLEKEQRELDENESRANPWA